MKCFPLVCWFYFTFSCFIASCFSCHICSLSPVKKWVLRSSCGPQVTKMWKEKRAQMYIWVHEQEVTKWHSYDFFSDQDIYLQSSKSWGTKYFPPCWQTSQWRPCVGKYTRYLLVCDMRSNSNLSGPRPFVMLLFCPMLEPGYWECPTKQLSWDCNHILINAFPIQARFMIYLSMISLFWKLHSQNFTQTMAALNFFFSFIHLFQWGLNLNKI